MRARWKPSCAITLVIIWALQVSPTNPICVRAAENSHRQGPEVCPSQQACDFEAVTGLTMTSTGAPVNDHSQLLAAISDGACTA